MKLHQIAQLTVGSIFALTLAACGGGGGDSTPAPVGGATTFTVGGTVTGLTAPVTLVNGTESLPVAASAPSYVFATPVASGGNYAITFAQPTGETCTLDKATGTAITANVTDANLMCSPITFTLGGSATGLTGSDSITLTNTVTNETATATVAAPTFTFATKVPFNGSYAVTTTSPTGKTCTVSAGGTGANVSADSTGAVSVVCSAIPFTVSGSVTGLATGESVTVKNNGTNATSVLAASPAFSFTVASGSHYAVSVDPATQPAGKTCSVTAQPNGSAAVTANVTGVVVTCGATPITISGTVTGLVGAQQVTPANNGANLTAAATASSNTFSFTIPSGAAYAVTVPTANQPSGETCMVTANGSGTNVTANVSGVAISCRLPMAYVANSGDGTVAQFSIGLDGTLIPFTAPTVATTPIIATPKVHNIAVAKAADGTAHFVYAVSADDNIVGTVSQYKVNADGSLTAINAGISTGGQNSWGIAVGTTGATQHVYVTNIEDWTVSQFDVDATTGALTPMSTAVLATGTGGLNHPWGITIDPSGRYAYVANFGTSSVHGNTISQFVIDQTTGELSPNATTTVTTDSSPFTITFNPKDTTGTNAYISDYYAIGGKIQQFSVLAGGSLSTTAVNTTVSSDNAWPLVIDPSQGKFGFFANVNDNTISQCIITGSSGALGSCAATSFATLNAPQEMSFDPMGRFLYVPNFLSTTVSGFSMDSGTGALTALTAPTTAAGAAPYSVTTAR